jgi:hypothetical protein
MPRLPSRIAVGIIAGTLLAYSTPSHAADFSYDWTYQAISMSGEIVEGDMKKLGELVAELNSHHIRTKVLVLNSGGGDYGEGVVLARYVKIMGWNTVVPPESHCNSMCFLLFAAGNVRLFSNEAHIGVHSMMWTDTKANSNKGACDATVSYARLLKYYNAPSGIIGKVVSTESDDITYLSTSDLTAGNWAEAIAPN